MSEQPIVMLHTDAPEAARAIIEAAHPGIDVHACDSFGELPHKLQQSGAEVLYSLRFNNEPFPRTACVEGERLRWVSVAGSGTDHLQPWDPAQVQVTNAAGVAADMMAEYAIGALLHFNLDFPRLQKAQEARQWISEPVVVPIAGQTLLVVGLGHTGRAVARRAKAMGMQVIGVRARPQTTENVDEVHSIDTLAALWPRADAVVCCVPKLANTLALIDAGALAALPPHAVLVDVSRGGVIAADALLQALQSGQLRGAALDVFEHEPLPSDSPFWQLDNAIISPHCSAVYPGWAEKSVEMFSDNLWRYRRGEALMNVVDPARGY